ncbi:CTP synthase [Mycoplasma capricolum]|uniref:CTP synthase n=1 Tax=Mycoplasma capricolum TaxID=2095 RepID=UPI0022F3FC45|nr:CTP synthase [Mycoplasma capricolum]WBX35818.1 CTP synthase [Mycoplasma capricolum subsp. capricolum]
MAKFIFVTGGVVSGLGKGITASSIGALLKASGLKVFMQKFDPYLNVDPGTMSPYQHGEVFVTKDGGETDLDLGHYERFIDEELTKLSSTTSGKIYLSVIKGERKGDTSGKTIQVVPHITDAIKNKVYQAAKQSQADVIISEIGGTVGDIESQPFIEAIRQIRLEQGKENVMFVHVVLLLWLAASKEYKTKPIQNSVKAMASLGIQPDVIVCRSDSNSPKDIKEKISLFCNVPITNIIDAIDQDSIYRVPLALAKQNLQEIIIEQLQLKANAIDLTLWKQFNKKIDSSSQEIEISFVGKYIELQDAYLSVLESLKIAGWEFNKKIKIRWIQAETLNESNYNEILKNSQGILVPGGFGKRGIEGMMLASRYARDNDIPYLGICLGMQIATISIARDLLNWTDADSTEFNKNTTHPIFDYIKGIDRDNIGGTLRLGTMVTKLEKDSLVSKLYNSDVALERHRHRYEFNNKYKKDLESVGLRFSGIYEEKNLVEVIEMPSLKFFVASQFHPEFTSRPNKPTPLFKGFIKAIIENNK